jgi:hypothetical protein
LLTSGDAALAAEAVGELESLRTYIRQQLPSFATTGARLRIVAFSSESEYHPYRVNSYSPAYFVDGPGQPTIVLGRLAKQTLPSLRHECIHAMVGQRAAHLPLWLEEGLADYYGGISPERARERRHLLERDGWIPLAELAQVRRDSVWYTDPQRAARFYTQSWALVSYLMETSGEGGLERLLNGPWPTTAEDWAPLEASLRAYLPSLHATGAPAGQAVPVTSEPAEPADVQVALARLLSRVGDFARARESATAVAAERPEAWAILGDIAFRQHDDLTARRALREAFRRGAADSRALWQLAVLEQSAPDGDVVPLLELLIAAEPAHDEARLVLTSHYLHQRRWNDALAQLRQIRSAPPDKSAFYRSALELASARAASPAAE